MYSQIGNLISEMNSNTIQHLELTNYFMPNIGLFCDSLRKNASLSDISLINCGLEAGGCVELQFALAKHTSIRKLHIVDNCIGNRGAEAIAQLICQNTQLQEIFLWRCSIDTDGVRSLTEALAQTSTLETLDLRWNRMIDNSCFDDVRRALDRNTTLHRLHIGMCSVDNAEQIDALCTRNRKRRIYLTIRNICQAFASLDLPPYVILEFVDYLSLPSDYGHAKKVDLIYAIKRSIARIRGVVEI